MTKIETKLTELACEFGFREITVQTEDGCEYFIRFEHDRCRGCCDTTLPEDDKALLEVEYAKSIIDRHHDAGWLIGYHHEALDGFVYRYAAGVYARRAEQEASA